ncbi:MULTISPECIES: hypothetical protein [Thermococcus]|uniref:hypothetical protein n=1 Tax=Thermococcus TaxID=2263 RepID=UPI00064FF891|nr:hypothetical protein [Thermococcus kodakarensis]WCN27431.1 hypothetical protein POG15_07435 [Thermococcus kodakarensis]WCN29720.1 hypothetical protein POG21_07425 [Thermococcus kodakarensis]
MERYLSEVLFTFFEDMLLIYFLGVIAGPVIYSLISPLAWIKGNSLELAFSIAIALWGVSIFQRGTLSVLNGKLPRFTALILVVIIPIMFILGYWPVASLLVGFLGGYTEYQNKESGVQGTVSGS